MPDGHFDSEGGSRLRPVRVGDLPVEVRAGVVPLNVSLLLPLPAQEHEVVQLVQQSPPPPPTDGVRGVPREGSDLDLLGHDTGNTHSKNGYFYVFNILIWSF